MPYATISKIPRGTENLRDYEETVRRFSWKAARAELDGLPGGNGLNIAHEAVDRHAAGSRRDHLGSLVPTRSARVIATRGTMYATVPFNVYRDHLIEIAGFIRLRG